MAESADDRLSASYDLLMFDLDGVVYLDGRAVPHAAESIAEARAGGTRIAFITNNASRTPGQVSAHLRELGVGAEPADVVTSSQAAARVLLDRHGQGAAVAVLGADGLLEAVREAGLEPVLVGDPQAVALVSGYAPEVRWKTIMRAAQDIRNGLPWVATNADPSLPTGHGPAPGHGALVAMIASFAGVRAEVAGKPERPLFEETLRRVGGSRPLMIGDSLHTDIPGARRAETDSLLVLTGVTTLADLVVAHPDQRPTWIGVDLRALGRAGLTAIRTGSGWQVPDWSAQVTDGRLEVVGSGDPDGWWAVACAAAWEYLDDTGRPVETSAVSAPSPDRIAR